MRWLSSPPLSCSANCGGRRRTASTSSTTARVPRIPSPESLTPSLYPWQRTRLRRGKKERGAAVLGGLLERIGELEENGFAPGAAEERNSHRKAENKTHGDGDMGVARHGGGGGTAAQVVVAVNVVGQTRRRAGGRHQRVQFELIHHRVDPLRAHQAFAFVESVQIFLPVKRPFFLRLEEQVLAEKGHFLFVVLLIELDDLLEVVHRGGITELRQ